jgi:hypothetical protein
MLARGGAVKSLDWLATQGMRQADIVMAEELAKLMRLNGVLTAEQVAAQTAKQKWSQAASQWWLDRRGVMIVYRGQDKPVATILSPIARTEGVAASEALVEKMRAAGLTSEEIAGYTARWHTNPVPRQFAPPELAGAPLGAAGIPTTRLPGVAAHFGETVYVIRLPKEAVIQVPRWGLAVENEHVILNQIPKTAQVGTIPAKALPKMTVNPSGRLTLTQ